MPLKLGNMTYQFILEGKKGVKIKSLLIISFSKQNFNFCQGYVSAWMKIQTLLLRPKKNSSPLTRAFLALNSCFPEETT